MNARKLWELDAEVKSELKTIEKMVYFHLQVAREGEDDVPRFTHRELLELIHQRVWHLLQLATAENN
jgi:hypothetical protein